MLNIPQQTLLGIDQSLDLARHFVKISGQTGDLVAPLDAFADARRQVAGGKAARRLAQSADW